MWSYALKRFAALVPTLLAISFVVFFMIHLAPGDPAQAVLGERATGCRSPRSAASTSSPMQRPRSPRWTCCAIG